MSDVTDLRTEAVFYETVDGKFQGTNIMFLRDGRPSSSRYAAPLNDQQALQHVLRVDQRVASKRGEKAPQPKATKPLFKVVTND